ncbi:MAG: cytochrome c biogenesis protein ResB [Candidatus Krumholzibacteriia bacterium]
MTRNPGCSSQSGSYGPSRHSRRFHLWIPHLLFSMKFAIWIAVILALASVAGVLVQEFFPVRNAREAHLLSERLPEPIFRSFMALQLHDPFRAVWFRALLGALSASLLLCALKNFRPNFRQAFHVHVIRDPRSLLQLQSVSTLHHTTPELFDVVVGWLRRRFYFGSVQRGESERLAALHQGGVSRMGPILLHIGILVLVLGGLVSSLVGRRVFLLGSPGETLAIEGSPYALRVDDFRIEENERGQVKQYRSRLTVLEGEHEVLHKEISVNHPLRFGGFNVYQSSYQTDPTRASELVFAVRPPGGQQAQATAGSADAGPSIVRATMGTSHAVPGHPGYEFEVRRFFAHLKITSKGPVNASREFANPAAELVVSRDGETITSQWAFMHFPAHARPELPFVLELRDALPVFATGLEVNTNPGAPLIWFGIGLSTLGLILSFLVLHRCIHLIARPAERGWTLWVGGRSERERIAFAAEFEHMVKHMHDEARRLRRAAKARESLAPQSPPSPARRELEAAGSAKSGRDAD